MVLARTYLVGQGNCCRCEKCINFHLCNNSNICMAFFFLLLLLLLLFGIFFGLLLFADRMM